MDVFLVTGFLGAGKTTLVNHLLTSGISDLGRVALIVNEAGDLGIDGKLLSGGNVDMIEIASGCICCTLKGDFSFDHNSATVRPGLYSEIERIANVLLQYPDTVIRVEGHTDSTGTEKYNLELSARRAVAVKNLIVEKGISANRLETVTYGETRPIATNETEAGRQMNRRVEIIISKSWM